MNAFVGTPTDLRELQANGFASLNDGHIFCSSLREVDELKHADKIYFIISKYSMCSTVYQELVFSALAFTKQANRRLLRLDETAISRGVAVLQSLPTDTLDEIYSSLQLRESSNRE